MSDGKSGRRPLLVGILGGTAALGAVTVAGRISSVLGDDDPGDPQGALQLTAESSTMAAATLALDADLLKPQSDGSRATRKLSTSTHSMVGVTWQGSETPRIKIRSRSTGGWTPWRRLATMHDGPDDASAESSPVRGTELVWTGDADGIQVHVAGDVPDNLTLTLLRPARLAGDAAAARTTSIVAGRTSAGGTVSARKSTNLKPTLRSRKSWGADESLRGTPQYNTTIQQAHVHHSASGNDYAQADVPALIRGFYRYHTKSLGWSDIGYNFLVDRFGGIWVGRAGGAGRPVRGAHTLGFNATSVGICVIGNFESVVPSTAVLQSVAAVAAWKLNKYGVDPNASVRVSSEGSDKYGAGKAVQLRTIDGHRDTNDTACPGQHLYDRLQTIRDLAVARIAQGTTPGVQVTAPSTLVGAPVLGQVLSVAAGSYSPAPTSSSVAWLRNGTPIAGATGSSYAITTADLGATIGVRVTTSSTGYTPAVETLAGAVARAASKVKAKAKTRRGVTTVEVRVKGRGVDARGSGPVVVRVGKRRRQAVLQNGVAKVTYPDLPKGRSPLLVKFPGDGLVAPGRLTRTLKISRRG